jgi:hypothetical protein
MNMSSTQEVVRKYKNEGTTCKFMPAKKENRKLALLKRILNQK